MPSTSARLSSSSAQSSMCNTCDFKDPTTPALTLNRRQRCRNLDLTARITTPYISKVLFVGLPDTVAGPRCHGRPELLDLLFTAP
ncbi:hypothetical protein NDU88_005719 [Pleurodeles waltl]|uniref:Uncharacterized protein n=1 Tax=Pleurodeles waltl TaxID=8319 RepID=A0AAV7PIY1_PLEWA|nr:hypothetical protein NDU88_005719 [Pleurodeles waltl]